MSRKNTVGVGGFIYVVKFSDGVLKVGRAIDADHRLRTHESNARFHGRQVKSVWQSPRHVEWMQNEARLIQWCAERPGTRRVSTERFVGIPFTDAVAYAKSLQCTPADEAPTATTMASYIEGAAATAGRAGAYDGAQLALRVMRTVLPGYGLAGEQLAAALADIAQACDLELKSPPPSEPALGRVGGPGSDCTDPREAHNHWCGGCGAERWFMASTCAAYRSPPPCPLCAATGWVNEPPVDIAAS